MLKISVFVVDNIDVGNRAFNIFVMLVICHRRRKMIDAGERHMSVTRSLRGHFYLGRSYEASWRTKHLMRKVGGRFWACRREGVPG